MEFCCICSSLITVGIFTKNNNEINAIVNVIRSNIITMYILPNESNIVANTGVNTVTIELDNERKPLTF
ncbi:hypothetical protein D3C77_558160 [compost metagenome]